MGVRSCLGYWVLTALTLATASLVSRADTNEWLKPSSGYWEEPYWSLGRLPANQDVVLFDTSGFKALAIGSSTVMAAPDSLSVGSLIIEAPANSFNQLLLNYAGFGAPLFVSSNLVVGTNGSLASHHSALVASNFYIGATAQFLDGSTAAFTNVFAGADPGAELDLSNSIFSAGMLQLGSLESSGNAAVNQSGGTNEIDSLAIYPGSTYTLADGGTLEGNALEMHSALFEGTQFAQSGGGVHFGSVANVGSNPESPARLSLSGGSFQAASLRLDDGSFTQTGGTNLVGALELNPNSFTSGSYTLSDGLLVSSNLAAGAESSGSEPPAATFTQSGGVHTNGNLTLSGTVRSGFALALGSYHLNGGLLVSSSEDIDMGSISQTDGTNYVDELSVFGGGSYSLAGGQVVSSNVSLSTPQVETIFSQTGGDHRIMGLLSLNRLVTYSLGEGTLEVSNIEVDAGGQLLVEGGTVTNSGLCAINAGLVSVRAPEVDLGQLGVSGSSPLIFASRPTNSTIAFLPGGVTVRFRDSHDIPWSAPGLFIQNWDATGGPDHIFVGDNSGGLTARQLSLVTFSNPAGLPPGDYPAAILPTGELVPSAAGPTLGLAAEPGELVLTWSGSFELYTSKNVSGPYIEISGASSPYTNTFSDPQRFFRLESE
ncbi:MAG TPA: hypothetical protein VHH88_08815 [Verrucomicrobiae bacterium]|nr:hypothetical protein [Verrucomicrobiae bacterium]